MLSNVKFDEITQYAMDNVRLMFRVVMENCE